MRLWSLHPSHLDRLGLVACWRESLLAQAVLTGTTVGYRQHPQLTRFLADPQPVRVIGAYLMGVLDESRARGYRFDFTKIVEPVPIAERLTVTEGQLAIEWEHLGEKLSLRSPTDFARWERADPSAHPLFAVVPGTIEP